jgi:hypothetical protein
MSCCSLPASANGVVVVAPSSRQCIGGIHASYSELGAFPPELHGILPPNVFASVMEMINSTLAGQWPCCFCFSCGVCCAPCTLGFSLCLPYQCIMDVRKSHASILNDFPVCLAVLWQSDLTVLNACICLFWFSSPCLGKFAGRSSPRCAIAENQCRARTQGLSGSGGIRQDEM